MLLTLGVHIPVNRGTSRLCQKEGMVCHSPWKTRGHILLHQAPVQWVQLPIQPNLQPV